MTRARIHIPQAEINAFCRKHHITRLALFGSVLRDDFTDESDIDVLVEFEPDQVPGSGILHDAGRVVGTAWTPGRSEHT